MKRDRLSFIVSFMPALCMAFMLGFELLVDNRIIDRVEYMVALAEVLPFLIPLLLIRLFQRMTGGEQERRFGGFTRHAVPFVVLISLTTAVLSFLLNAGVSMLVGGAPESHVPYADSIGNWGIALLLVAVLPSIFEEFFFRGGVLPAFEGHGTATAIFVSALTFALIHGNAYNLVGPLAAGMVYGYLTYTLGSVWPAVFAHMLNNGLYLLLGHVTRSYSTLGIWPYFLLAMVFLLGLLLWLSMGSLKSLLSRGKVKRLKAGGIKGLMSCLLFSPGLWLLALMYIIKIAYL